MGSFMPSFKNDIQGKTGILTGGSSGFGLEIVRWLKSAGARVAVFSVDMPPDDLRNELEIPGEGRVKFFIQDVMEDRAAEEMVDRTLMEFGALDFVIINAGFALRFEKPLLQMDLSEMAAAFRTQFNIFPLPMATLSLAASRVMREKYESIEYNDAGHPTDTGSIVVTLSEAALHPLRDDLLAYSAAKTACLGILRSLAATLGPLNIRVNGIAPGFANTEGPKKFYSRFPAIRKDIDNRDHLKPAFMHPGAVIPAVEYLLSDNYVTGEVLALDGGYNINLVRYFQDY